MVKVEEEHVALMLARKKLQHHILYNCIADLLLSDDEDRDPSTYSPIQLHRVNMQANLVHYFICVLEKVRRSSD